MNNSCNLLDHDQFLVFGAARSGLAVARLLVGLGKRVGIYDEAPPEKLEKARAEAEKIGAPIVTKLEELGFPNGWQVLVLSPGIPTTHPLVVLAEECGCVVRSEIEIAYLASPAPIVAITGTNGKTTVTHLVEHIFNRCGRPTVMGGNVGRPLSDAVLDPKCKEPGAVIACEVSSFQLETIERFRPRVACVLNITPDHLDRYGAMSNYMEAKYRVMENQKMEDHLIVNGDDYRCLSFLPRAQAEGWVFSLRRPVDKGAFLQEKTLYLSQQNRESATPLLDRDEIPLPGLHNVANVLAALTIGAAMGLDRWSMADAVRDFQPVAHRIEPLGEIDGARYYNDSKATNLDSMRKALESFCEPSKKGDSSPTPKPRVVLIAGGRDKGASWRDLTNLVSRSVKGLVPMGEAAPLAREAWGQAVGEMCEAHDMNQAVRLARKMASPGDIVLLSPGCASFDMFSSYEERGDCFRDIVRGIQAESA